MQKTLLLSLAWSGRCLVIALHTHLTNKSGAYQGDSRHLFYDRNTFSITAATGATSQV